MCCAAKGATIAELAHAFDAAISTIWQWKISHPQFFEFYCAIADVKIKPTETRPDPTRDSYIHSNPRLDGNGARVDRAEFERELIRTRMGKGPGACEGEGVILGRKPRLTSHQRREAIARREAERC